MKKTNGASCLLLTAVLLTLLTGCATTSATLVEHEEGSSAAEKSLAGEVGEKMQATDWSELSTLISTAQPREVSNWTNDLGYAYTFTSVRIFVNGRGQACRTYTLRAKKLFSNRETPSLTACRVAGGRWQVSKD